MRQIEGDRYLDKILHMRRENDLRIGEELMKSALRQLSRVTPQNEAEWLSKAQNLSLNALEEAVREALNDKDSVEKGSLGIDDRSGDTMEGRF